MHGFFSCFPRLSGLARLLALGFDSPPDRVSTGAARRERRSVAKWALVSLERREDGSAFVGLVPVLELVFRHEASIPRNDSADIGWHPDTGP